MKTSLRRRRRSPWLTPPMILSYAIAAVLVLIYFAGVIFFHSHYLPNTTIGNITAGLLTPSYVEEQNAARCGRYALMVTDRNGTLSVIEGHTIDYAYEARGLEQEILDGQNPFAWPLAFLRDETHTFGLSSTFDTAKLAQKIEALPLFSEDAMKKPVNASISLEKDGYTIVAEKAGTIPIREEVLSEITNAVSVGKTSITLSDTCYEAPQIHSSSAILLEAADRLDHYLRSVITYQFWDAEEVTFGREEIMSALQMDENFNITINTKSIDDFVYRRLASPYNTYGDKREFETALGDTVTIGGGDYGWVVNKTKEAEEIIKNLEAGVPVTREPIWSQTARVSGPDDIGTTYIEVDYTNQHLYYFKEGDLLFESDFVSGKMSNGNGSPDGIFSVSYKQRDATLKGETYNSHVDYFIVFAYNVGFHDASWRKTFGGTIYLKSGSHGCINMPLAKVTELYELVAKGTPVVAYYREPVVLHTENCRISNAFSYRKPETTDPSDSPTATGNGN